MEETATHGVVRVVQPQAPHDPDLLARQRREQARDRQAALREARGGVERAGAEDLERRDRALLVRGEPDCGGVSGRAARAGEARGAPSRVGSTGCPRWICEVSAATKRMRRVQDVWMGGIAAGGEEF